LLVNNRSDSKNMNGATIRFIFSTLAGYGLMSEHF